MLDNFCLSNCLFYILRIIILTMYSLKSVFIVFYENRLQCKIKYKSKQAGVQKDFYEDIVKGKDCCAKIYL